MATGRENKLAGQIGEHLVCAELGRRGIIATPFSGNVSTFDILAADEFCRTVPIQVKASRADKWPSDARRWMQLEFDQELSRQNYSGATKLLNPNLIYIYVAIALQESRDDRFFILTESDVQNVYVNHYTTWMEKLNWKRPRNPNSFDCRPKLHEFEIFEDNWQLISSRLTQSDLDHLP